MNDTGYPDGPARRDGRLLALRCLGLPQAVTRTPMSRRRALRYRLAALWARIRPRTTAELASLVLRLSDEIDTRDRMLDAALGPAGSGPDRRELGQIRGELEPGQLGWIGGRGAAAGGYLAGCRASR